MICVKQHLLDSLLLDSLFLTAQGTQGRYVARGWCGIPGRIDRYFKNLIDYDTSFREYLELSCGSQSHMSVSFVSRQTVAEHELVVSYVDSHTRRLNQQWARGYDRFGGSTRCLGEIDNFLSIYLSSRQRFSLDNITYNLTYYGKLDQSDYL